tara:strand:+ start:481 stop:867 length:387 start_codon:yes stop_codon:yes gene_type:complete
MELEGRLAYFAHSKRKYNSKEEFEQLNYLEFVFSGTVICPNNNLGELGSIQPYLDVVSKMDFLFVAEYHDWIGTGVRLEIKEARKNNIPIYVIRKGKNGFVLRKLKRVKSRQPLDKVTHFAANLEVYF